MNAYNDEDFADLIREETGIEWEDIKDELPGYQAAALIDIMTELGLFVNKQLAQEIAKRDDAVFYLRKLIQDGKHWRSSGPGDSWSPIHVIHILPLIRNKAAFELLLDIIRYHEDDLNYWLTEDVPGLMVAFGEEFIELLKEFSEDETLEAFARSTATGALGTLGIIFPLHQNEIKQHLIKLLKITEDGTFAGIVADDLASFHDPSVMPEIHRAFKEGRIDDPFVNEEELEDVINGVFYDLDEDNFKRNTANPLDHFSFENIEHLHLINSKEEEEDEFEEDSSCLEDEGFESEMDYEKPEKKKIGRNEPCPCGSGLKYKKCCIKNDK
ncbi:MAG: DUF1186 domain-containing protein [ANME-2 cluster archaeon]|nr:DUF1186 domain-containing protein [ANME-2 cluster archaeon]